LAAPRANADIAAIQQGALPQETAVLAAYDDAGKLEAYSRSWTNDWKYPVSKAEVAARLGKALDFLSAAAKNHPDNAELLLLTGLVAHYAYNVDVPQSYDKAMAALDAAQKLAGADIRAGWFHASILCQLSQPKAGADAMLAIEAGHGWNQLPAGFWDDYMECATVTNMPAHVLRAASYLEKLHARDSWMRTFLANGAAKRFDRFDRNRNYEPKEVWRGAQSGDNTEFTSTTCGVRFLAYGDWSVNQIAVTKGTCVAYFSTGPYKAKRGALRPSILVMVKEPDRDQTLEDFAVKFTQDGTFSAYTPTRCPADKCLAKSGIQTGMYKENGDGHGRILMFERDQPEFPGLLFEAPSMPPQAEEGKGTQYFRPSQIQERIPGKLYYVVLLDTAASIEEPAMKDFDFFLANLVVE
jgi:hypothetical protein